MAVGTGSDARARIDDLKDRLQPSRARERALGDLDALFVSGRAPGPAPDGFLPGELLTTSIGPAADTAVRRIASVWMPWQGKSFEAADSTGVNILTPNARGPLRMLWPSYEPESEDPESLKVLSFNTRVAPGEVDPTVHVLKIDYDHTGNPDFVIRKILDELVQVDEGFYLGKILYRWRGSFTPIGFFTLGA